MCSLLCLIPLILYLNLRRCYQLTRVSDEHCIIDFKEEDIHTELPGHSRSVLEWAAVQRYSEGRATILIYLARTRFLAIPKRILGPGQREELLSLLNDKISNREAKSA